MVEMVVQTKYEPKKVFVHLSSSNWIFSDLLSIKEASTLAKALLDAISRFEDGEKIHKVNELNRLIKTQESRLIDSCGSIQGCHNCFNKNACFPFMFGEDEVDIIAPMNYIPIKY